MNGTLSEGSRLQPSRREEVGRLGRCLRVRLRLHGADDFDPVLSIVNPTAGNGLDTCIKPGRKVSNARLGAEFCLTLSKHIK